MNKGLGLKEMAASISLDLKSVVAFGDGDNDVEFLEANSKNLSKYSLSHVSP